MFKAEFRTLRADKKIVTIFDFVNTIREDQILDCIKEKVGEPGGYIKLSTEDVLVFDNPDIKHFALCINMYWRPNNYDEWRSQLASSITLYKIYKQRCRDTVYVYDLYIEYAYNKLFENLYYREVLTAEQKRELAGVIYNEIKNTFRFPHKYLDF